MIISWKFKFQWKAFWNKALNFTGNLFQIKSIDNIQTFHWLSHKITLVSQTENYFENPQYHFLGELILILLSFKKILYEKGSFLLLNL